MHPKIVDLARGRWRGILLTLGLSEVALNGKHGPCPFCDGKDRFRWDNKEGRGTFICSECGAGDGMDLVMRFLGVGFAEAAREVERLVRVVKIVDKVAPTISEAQRKSAISKLLASCHSIEKGDEVDRYLAGRGIDEPKRYPPDLLTCEECWFADGVYLPAMIAIVRDPAGNIASLHRTFLKDGKKASVSEPRRLMPGIIPDGAAIRLGPVNSVLGIAEGIETAIAACHIFEHPVWPALNTSILRKWVPPSGVEEVVVYGDNDESFAGQAAAYDLAARIRRTGLLVTVKIPILTNTDWADDAAQYRQSRLSRTAIAAEKTDENSNFAAAKFEAGRR